MKTIRFTVIVLGMAALATSGFSDDLLNRGRGGSGGNGAGQSSGNDRNRSSGGDRVRNDSSGGQRGSGGGGVDRIRSGGGSSGNSGGIDRGRGNSGGSGTGRSSGGDDRIRNGGGSSGNSGGIDRGRGNSGGSGTGRSSGGDDRIRSGGGSSGNQGGIDRGRGNSGGSGTGRSSGGDDRIRNGGGSSGNQGGIDRGRGNSGGDDRIRNGGGSSGNQGGIDRGRGNSGGDDRRDGPPRIIIGPGGIYNRENDKTRDRIERGQGNSRSVYGTISNQRAGVVDVRNQKPITIGKAPINVFRGPLSSQARRESIKIIGGNYRSGYYHYDSRWRDDNFFFGFYSFQPDYDRCRVSPWYYYPHLPGYVRHDRVIIVRPLIAIFPTQSWYYPWSSGYDYSWHRFSYDSDRYSRSALDSALDDLVYAFERQDRRAIARLVPENDRVGIWIDEDYGYSLRPDDFYDMLLDNVLETRTVRYEILNVRRWQNDARVLVRHEYEDPWGRNEVVYHTYRFVQSRGEYVIADFGTSNYRPRF